MSEKISLFDMLEQKEKNISSSGEEKNISIKIQEKIKTSEGEDNISLTSEEAKKPMKRPLVNRGLEVKPNITIEKENNETSEAISENKLSVNDIEIIPLKKDERKIVNVFNEAQSQNDETEKNIIIEAKNNIPEKNIQLNESVINAESIALTKTNKPEKIIIDTQNIIKVKKEKKDKTLIANGILILTVLAFSLYSTTVSPLF